MQPSIGRRATLAGLAAAPLAPRVRAQVANPIRIGVLTDASGPYADSGGPASLLAAKLAVQDFGPHRARPAHRNHAGRHPETSPTSPAPWPANGMMTGWTPSSTSR